MWHILPWHTQLWDFECSLYIMTFWPYFDQNRQILEAARKHQNYFKILRWLFTPNGTPIDLGSMSFFLASLVLITPTLLSDILYPYIILCIYHLFVSIILCFSLYLDLLHDKRYTCSLHNEHLSIWVIRCRLVTHWSCWCYANHIIYYMLILTASAV